MTEKDSHKEKEIPFLNKLKSKIYSLLRLNPQPVIKVYNGFGNDKKITVLGHVLKLSPLPRHNYRQNRIINFFSMLRLFMVIPFSYAKISVEWGGIIYKSMAEKDGFFRLEIFPETPPNEGWQKILVKLEEKGNNLQLIESYGSLYIPVASKYGFISDIDDTFLVSYSRVLRRKLYVLFTKNAHTRKPFEGVANHYRLLAQSWQKNNSYNPFFYVSGSEWNLYNLLEEFSLVNEFPKGIFLLSSLKRIFQFWNFGRTNLMTKFARIVRVIEYFPKLKFVLLGDDSQKDPEIYLSVVTHFPENIFAVYIRCVGNVKSDNTLSIISKIESYGVSCCYFKHSAEAVIHSKLIGLTESV